MWRGDLVFLLVLASLGPALIYTYLSGADWHINILSVAPNMIEFEVRRDEYAIQLAELNEGSISDEP